MRAYLALVVAISLCVAGGVFVEHCLSADNSPLPDKQAQEKMATLEKLKTEKLEAAKQRYLAVTVSYKAGTEVLSNVYAASIGWKEAAYERAKTKKDRQTALQEHSERMTDLYKKIHILAQVDARGGEAAKDASARFWDLEAKIWVLQE